MLGRPGGGRQHTYHDPQDKPVSAVSLPQLARLKRSIAACTSLDEVLKVALDTAIGLHKADFGNVQLYRDGVLIIAAQRGFTAPFLDTFRQVSVDDGSACGRAMREGNSIIVHDVTVDPDYSPFRAVAADAGYRGVQSTPLVAGNGRFVGMISTHFARPHTPSEEEMMLLDFYAEQVADAIVSREPGETAPAQTTRA